ncbi:DUF924 domain-containing protein [Leptolyngbya cf. ectocarpi LEGE 11479]|uniref:DUF924 domain-containing protein n=1 Tax=Leptolyngbya cf. ectocarpi LEGE 11479 TaxID=1828722 RepID=A0A928WYV6_LEPEC|nr:DUF924 family protein [Leptolyngbya ectocarpi]MBE9065934.1 DUF924 domain-containing protein [Leptolyngbya cf. ectocarpi LEGE 11479]
MNSVVSNSQSVLDFWFGSPADSFRKQWFRKDPDFDAQIKNQFLDLYWAMVASSAEPWLRTAKASLARIIVLDQFARNMFRDTPQSFAADPLALTTAATAIDRGYGAELLPVERMFLYLPFEHSENLTHQNQSVAYFEALVSQTPDLAHVLDYARRHRDVIAQFGRFPHRNKILGRQSTEAELTFLKQPGSRF